MIKSIPISSLVPSTRNVRRASDARADAELKADIEARGLLQNLVVTPTRKPRGRFAVEAGGRRLRALQALVAEGKVGPGHPVCCLVLDRPGGAVEASLAENFQRLAMNPADECLAFGRLADEGSDVASIASRFGLSTRFVEGRLRLAALAPIVFEALGAGEISLEIAQAYGTTSDRERQAYVFERLRGGYGAAHPDSVRRMMTLETASGTDRRARFVGEEAYVAAGGRIERDLFSEDGEACWLDPALLERLAGEKLQAMAQARAEAGLSWVRPILDDWICSRHTDGLDRVTAEREPFTNAEVEEVEALESEAEALGSTLGDEDAGEAEHRLAEHRLEAIGARLAELEDRPLRVDPELKARIGTFLLLDDQGRPCLANSFYVERKTAEAEGGEEASESGSDPASAGRKSPAFSQRLADELAMQRRDILAVHLAGDPRLALDLLVFLMVDSAGRSIETSGSTLAAHAPTGPLAGFEPVSAPATIALGELDARLERGWTEGETRADRFDAFRALPEAARQAWLGHAVARTLQASANLPGLHHCAFHDHLGAARNRCGALVAADRSQLLRPDFQGDVAGCTAAGRRPRARRASRPVEKGRAQPGLRADLRRRLHRR